MTAQIDVRHPAIANGSPNPATIACRTADASKLHGRGDTRVQALDNVTVEFETGRLTSIMGPSGSGKSTLLHCMAALERPTSGEVWIGNQLLNNLDETALTHLRRDQVGFVFQAFNLVPTLTARENITLPNDLAGRKTDPAWLKQVVAAVGLDGRLDHRPAELSGGQQQRVAVARALTARPEIIFADEPTGNLDSRTGSEILAFLRQAVDDLGQTIVMVTHDPVAASFGHRVVFLKDGQIVGEQQNPSAETVLIRMNDLARPTAQDEGSDQ